MFTDKSFMELQRSHRGLNSKEFFTNLKKFSFAVKRGPGGKDIITDKDLDDIFENFFRAIQVKELTPKK